MRRSTKMLLRLALLAVSCSGGVSSADFVEAGAHRSREYEYMYHWNDDSNRNDHRKTKHLQPEPTAAPITPLPTFAPTQVPVAASSADGSAGEISSEKGHADDSNNSADEGISTDSINTSSIFGVGGGTSKPAPIYELSHGLGVFTVASGTGCYEGAHGQAQARFGVANSQIDVFVPSVFTMLDPNSSPQDAMFVTLAGEEGNGSAGTDDDLRRRRLNEGGGDNMPHNDDQLSDDVTPSSASSQSHECEIFRAGRKSFNQISFDLKRRENPETGAGGIIKSTGTSYHQHGTFKAKEEWFDCLGGEYSLSCVHHECLMSLHFRMASSTGSAKDDNGKCSDGTCGGTAAESNRKRRMTSLVLQGTTELAYQGDDAKRLVCVENCENAASRSSNVDTDAEYFEGTINVRTFDNNVAQAHSSHSTKAPKNAKSAKAQKAAKSQKSKSQKKGKSTAAANLLSCSINTDCDNGIYCDGSEACLNGVCQASSGNPCSGGTPVCDETNDQCVACLADGDCGDGSFCTGVETCLNGVCQAGPGNPCSGAMPLCDETSDVCVECLVDSDCGDGLFCTGVETCLNGVCQAGPGNPCSGSTPVCDETNDQCVECLVDGDCGDGLFCTGVETCLNGVCQAGPGNPCSGSTPVCDETNDQCVECLVDGDCDDSFSCTVDSCSTNSCIFTPVDANCDDSLFCNGSEVCNTASPSAAPGTGCVSSVNPCTSPAVCSETNDACNSCDTVFPLPSGAPSGYSCYDASDTVYTDNCVGIETVIIVNTNAATQSTHQSTTAPSLGSGFRLAEPRSAALDTCYGAILSPLSGGYPNGNNFYIGATDATPPSTEGEWVWESDSELFWTGGFGGSVVSGQYAGWDTSTQPNDVFPGEDCAEINYFYSSIPSGDWNDIPCSTSRPAIYELVV